MTPELRPPTMPKPRPAPSLSNSTHSSWVHSVLRTMSLLESLLLSLTSEGDRFTLNVKVLLDAWSPLALGTASLAFFSLLGAFSEVGGRCWWSRRATTRVIIPFARHSIVMASSWERFGVKRWRSMARILSPTLRRPFLC